MDRIPAHKLVLANGSDVLAAMFFGELRETGDILVTDASIDAFKAFLQFFYSTQVGLTVDNVGEVMNLGHKYNVDKCVDVCVDFLKDTITDENFCTGLNLSILYGRIDLQIFYEQYFVMHAKAVFKSATFLNCDKTLLAHILDINLRTGAETMVFGACMAWIKMQSQQDAVTRELVQYHLGELFYEIDFGKMTIGDFAAIVRSNGLVFSVDEYKEIIEVIMFPGTKPKLFSGKLQQFRWNDADILLCDRKSLASNELLRSYHFLLKNQSTKFRSDQPVLLGSMEFAPLCNLSCGIEVDLETGFRVDIKLIEITHLDDTDHDLPDECVLLDFKIELPSRKEKTIVLPMPIAIRPQLYYEIRLERPPQDEHCVYKCGGLTSHVQLKNNVNINFYGDRIGSSRTVNLITALAFNSIV